MPVNRMGKSASQLRLAANQTLHIKHEPLAASRRRDDISTVGSWASALVSSSDANAVRLAAEREQHPDQRGSMKARISAVTYVACSELMVSQVPVQAQVEGW